MSKENNKGKQQDAPKPVVARNPSDIQRLKLEKLMKNPDKPVIIPEKPKERGAPVVPDFVRNVMGSSAGAGSGEFHVYRHLRRKEYARQHYMTEKARWEKMEDEYHDKILENKRKADEETAKKRAKRLKKKKNAKKRTTKPIKATPSSSSETEDEIEENSESADTDKNELSSGTKIEITKDDVENKINNENNELIRDKGVMEKTQDDSEKCEKFDVESKSKSVLSEGDTNRSEVNKEKGEIVLITKDLENKSEELITNTSE